MTHDAQELRTIAAAQADAIAIWRASKRAKRLQQYRRRMEQAPEPAPAVWLQAVARDDRTDPVEHEEATA